jgi:hypothetical protein
VKSIVQRSALHPLKAAVSGGGREGLATTDLKNKSRLRILRESHQADDIGMALGRQRSEAALELLREGLT